MFFCCCVGSRCNSETYVVHEDGLRVLAANASFAYYRFQHRTVRRMANQLQMNYDALVQNLIDYAHRRIPGGLREADAAVCS